LNLNKEFIDKSFLVILLLSSLAPQFNAIDNIAIRWFLIGFFSIIYLFISRVHFNKNFFILIILLLAPIFLAENLELYISEYLRIILIIISFFLILNSFKNISNPLKFICYLFSVSIAIESLYLFIDMIINPNTFTGISMNRNVSSFSILLKLPLLIYLINQECSSKHKKYLLNLIQICSLIAIVILQSRLAIILLPIIYLSIFFFTSFTIKKFLTPIIVILISFFLVLGSFKTILNSESEFQFDILDDTSLNQRIGYYFNGIELIKENPFLGKGLGSWKIESLRFSEHSGDKTIIPYYVHNDFIQIFVELGVVGFLLYLLFFGFLYKQLFKEKFSNESSFFLIVIISIFLIDTLLNFPFYRPQEIMPFLFISSFIFFQTKKNIINYRLSRFGNLIILLILIPILILNYRWHLSLIDQKTLLSDYYNKSYTLEKNNLSSITIKYPSLASNTIPISSLLARYYLENKNFEKAKELLNHSNSINQYDLLTKELYLLYNLETYNLSEALSNANELFELSRDNETYAELYFSIASSLNLNQVFELSDVIYNSSNFTIHKLFYENYILIKNYDKVFLSELLMISLKLFPEEKFLYDLNNLIKQ